ncbi:MAG: hypothetical protein JNJ80_20205 [Gemmatimonadetes bacterium]|nr:hypothetical protein [Gemmatimonadota bacterium]
MRRATILLGLVVAGCGGGEPSRWARATRINAERQDLFEAATLRDALTALPAAVTAAPNEPVAVVDLALADSMTRAEVAAIARRLWTRAAGGSAERVVILGYRPAIEPPGPDHRWRAFRGAVLPGVVDPHTCVVLVPSDDRRMTAGQSRLLRTTIEEYLAPCVFRARFGPPGSAIANWLRATGHRGVRSLDWLLRPTASLPEDFWWFAGFGGESDESWGRILPFVALAAGADGRIPPYYLGRDAVGCLAGRAPDCVALITDSIGVRPPGPARRIAGLAPFGDGGWTGFQSGSLGPARWISELIRQGGEERFRALWRADGELATAFERVYREPLGSAVATWARHDWEGRVGEPPVRLGASLDPVVALATACWTGLFVALAVVGARRRSLRP